MSFVAYQFLIYLYKIQSQNLSFHSNLFRDDDMGSFMIRNEEADIQGADGHIYKGRFEKTRFPDLQTAPAVSAPSFLTHVRGQLLWYLMSSPGFESKIS